MRPPAAYMHLLLESCPYSCACSRCRRTTMYRLRRYAGDPRLARPADLPTTDQHARPRRCWAPASPTCASMEKRPVCMSRLTMRGPQEARTRGGSVLPEVSPACALERRGTQADSATATGAPTLPVDVQLHMESNEAAGLITELHIPAG